MSDQEFEECCQYVINKKEQKSRQNKEFYNNFFNNNKSDSDKNKEFLEEIFPELEGNIYYRNNIRPAKFIVALKGVNHLVEIEAGLERSLDKDDNVQLQPTTKHNRTFLICRPTEIKRHLNPFMHLEPEDAAPKYSISFVDSTGEPHTFQHKTLAGTISSLKDLGYVSGDGAENALGTILLGFKKMQKILDNNDVDVEGFFIDKVSKRIVSSKIIIKDPKDTKSELLDALYFIDELTKYYRGRRDLLAHSLVWGMVAPIIFILKTSDYYLEYLFLYGASNALKSTSGKIVLAIDRHQEDQINYAIKLTHINTLARFGSKISKSTFPILIDEMDLNAGTGIIKDSVKESLISAVKIAVDSKILRQKFENSTDTDMVLVPALSPLFMTSNYSPPTHNEGFMKRVIDRHHEDKESRPPTEPESIACMEFMRVNLPRLGALGDFRNWYVMNNQDFILDDKRPLPLEIGFKILTAAYEYVGKEVPIWLSLKLPQNQLEQAVQDNASLVKHALEEYIVQKIKDSLIIFKNTGSSALNDLSSLEVSERIYKMASYELLPGIKINKKTGELLIYRGFLENLYNDHRITTDQIPNLKSLANYMNANYRKIGNWVVAATKDQLHEYFDKEQTPDEE